jgi:TRAP-type mannitol/chloroaromatic compound transport system permease large subunit
MHINENSIPTLQNNYAISSYFRILVSNTIFLRWYLGRLKATRWVPRVGQELPIRPEHQSSSLVFSGVRVIPYLAFCVGFCELLFIFLSFFFWSLNYLSFDLRLLNTLLVFSGFSQTSYRFVGVKSLSKFP